MSRNPLTGIPVLGTDGDGVRGRQAADAILALLRRRKATNTGGGRLFYSPAEWRARGEKYGTTAVLIVTHDGGEQAPFFNWDYDNPKAVEAMRKALESVACYVEQCTSWYSAVYPIG